MPKSWQHNTIKFMVVQGVEFFSRFALRVPINYTGDMNEQNVENTCCADGDVAASKAAGCGCAVECCTQSSIVDSKRAGCCG